MGKKVLAAIYWTGKPYCVSTEALLERSKITINCLLSGIVNVMVLLAAPASGSLSGRQNGKMICLCRMRRQNSFLGNALKKFPHFQGRYPPPAVRKSTGVGPLRAAGSVLKCGNYLKTTPYRQIRVENAATELSREDHEHPRNNKETHSLTKTTLVLRLI